MNIFNIHSVPYTHSEISAKLPFVSVIPFTLLIEAIMFFIVLLFLFYIVHCFQTEQIMYFTSLYSNA